MRAHHVLLVGNLALLVATSEATTERVGSRECAQTGLHAQSFDVRGDGALTLAVTGDALGAIEGSLWLFAHPERACRAEVVVDQDHDGPQPASDPDAPSPRPASGTWIAAGEAWEVPISVDGDGGSEVTIDVSACDGVVAELDLTVEGCGKVRLAPR